MVLESEVSMRIIRSVSGDSILVDDEDYERLTKYRWYSTNGYAQRYNGGNRKPFLIRMNREIMEHYGHNIEGLKVDHKDLNGLNNTKLNLRKATHPQNLWNRPKPPNNTSGYKGVSWHKKGEFYVAYITANKKRIRLGCYDDSIEAAKAYDKAAIKLHGEFARLNFPIGTNLDVKPRKTIIQKNSTSGYRGVSYRKDSRKWRAEFHHRGKKMIVGLFTTAIEAAKAYNETAIKYLGNEARLNVI